MIAMLLLGCAGKAPPPLFAPLPPRETPVIPAAIVEAEKAGADPDECTKAYTVQPGVPFDEGCRGHVIPTSDFVEYLRMQAELPFYKLEAEKQYELRQADRNLANTAHLGEVTENRQHRKEATGLRAAVIAGVALGLLGGTALGVGAAAAVGPARIEVTTQATPPE